MNGDLGPLTAAAVVSQVLDTDPEAVLIGHSGSTTAHPVAMELARRLKAVRPDLWVIYGGVFPTYHWQDVLRDHPEVDVIVRGEGEETSVKLVAALCGDLSQISGIAYRKNGAPVATRPAPMIHDLDANRIGWELIDFTKHSYWGGKRAVILQFSRGCPHLCTYCGQRGFWTQWRHRDPVKLAQEIAWLVREHGIELVNLADENPTSSRRLWRAFLDALIAEDVEVLLIGSTRADDIVRDRDILPLYKKAGVLRFLMGLEGTDEATLEAIQKGGTRAKDREAIQLLRDHGMIGLCTFAVGFEDETDRSYWHMMRTLLDYDPDQVMSIYATPHRWTPFFEASKHRRVVERDLERWDYKHQVLATQVPPWRVFLWVKLIEIALQIRPRALWRNYFHPDPEIRHAMQWYTRMGRRVVTREVWRFVTGRRLKNSPTVAAFWRADEGLPEEALSRDRAA